MPVTKEPGCTPCRQRHIRCDRGLPKCSGCMKSRKARDCKYEDLRIRHSHHTALSEMPPVVESGSPEDVEPEPEPEPHDDAWPGRGRQPTNGDLDWQPMLREQLEPTPRSSSSMEGLMHHVSAASAHLISPGGQSTSVVRQISPVMVSRDHPDVLLDPLVDSTLQVSDVVESRVFDFYIRVVGCWLDVVSPARHFSRTAAQLATTEPAVYYPCLTYASRVLYLRGELEKEVAEHFHEKANHLLIHLLSEDRAALKSDVLVTTTVILRMWEQLYEVHSDGQFHLNSAFSVFVRPGLSWSTRSSDLSSCAFWLFVRQNIRASFLREQAVHCDLSYVEDEDVYTPDSDEVWTNRITLLLARLCNACWGDVMLSDRHGLLSTLEARLEEWKRCLPLSFQPWSNIRVVEGSFPIVRYLCTWHTIAWHFYYASKVLLAVYNPKRPMNQSTLMINQYINREIVAPAQLLCAICFSDSDIGSAINGPHLMGWCGQFFTGSIERSRLRDYMQKQMEENKWPNQACIARLESAWYGMITTP